MDNKVNGLICGKLPGMSALILLHFEPVGRWFESFCSRRQQKHTLSQSSQLSSSSQDDDEELSADEDDLKLLMTLDPKDWKEQDHYAVLGLSKLRVCATDDQIKRAYKKKVLRHHPDKRRARHMQVKEGEEDYFTCITRAYEVLGNVQKRKSYDSVDPLFDNTIPSVSIETKTNFYQTFGAVFERNARWSSKKPVPLLGDEMLSFESVNQFYSFWYEFDSWREYSYLDEEEKEKGENRDERRWIEKQNKANRQRLKKEEVTRIRQLVDNSYNCDPRIAQFKQLEKEKKLTEKKAKQDIIRKKVEEEEQKKQKIVDEEKQKKEREEEKSRIQAAAIKKEREAQKKLLKNEKKLFRTAMKGLEYLATDEAQRLSHMQQMELLAEQLSVTSLQCLNEVLLSGDTDKAKESFLVQVREIKEQSDREKMRQIELSQRPSTGATMEKSREKELWTELEIQMLIKAVNLFPAGTSARWETIANFLKLHISDCCKSAKDVLAKAKDLQRNDRCLKDDANKRAFEKFSTEPKVAASNVAAEVSERYETAAEMQVYELGSNPAPWTAEEQRLLEQAMRTYPASLGSDRWDRISESIPARSKKDCMKRYKELVELVRTKKMAQAATTTKK